MFVIIKIDFDYWKHFYLESKKKREIKEEMVCLYVHCSN